MKITSLTILISTILFCSQSHGQSQEFKIKQVQKDLAQIDNHIYASIYEVSNQQYAAFLSHLKESNQTKELEIAMVDSNGFLIPDLYSQPMVSHYHNHPAYSNYPTVNISYEGALLFCEWLTETYNNYPNRKFKKVIFRLPTMDEWVLAAKGGNPNAIYPWTGTELRNKKGMFMCNHKQEYSGSNDLKNGAFITAPIESYWPNAFGIYNMSGNVSELLASKNQTMGGSWRDNKESMKIDSSLKQHDEVPSPTVGFRYFMEVIEE